MTEHFHAVVCIDHAEAVVYQFGQGDVSEHRVQAERDGNIHHKAGSLGSGHEQDAKSYFEAVIKQIGNAHEILIVGHGNAKTDFARFIREHVKPLGSRIKGVETVDHPTKGEIIALAEKFFQTKDLTTPQIEQTNYTKPWSLAASRASCRRRTARCVEGCKKAILHRSAGRNEYGLPGRKEKVHVA